MEITLYKHQISLLKLFVKKTKLLGFCVTKLVLPPSPNPCPYPHSSSPVLIRHAFELLAMSILVSHSGRLTSPSRDSIRNKIPT